MVMTPINALMLFLIIADGVPTALKITSAVVITLTIHSFLRGYVRRLVVTQEGASRINLFRRAFIAWCDVRLVDVYLPGGGIPDGRSGFVFITTLDRAPAGPWQNDDSTIQVQNREGLLEAIRAAQKESKPETVERAA